MEVAVVRSGANWVKIRPSQCVQFFSGSCCSCVAIDLAYKK